MKLSARTEKKQAFFCRVKFKDGKTERQQYRGEQLGVGSM
jgi:hypothetical protein